VVHLDVEPVDLDAFTILDGTTCTRDVFELNVC